jgi:hypothetical protein
MDKRKGFSIRRLEYSSASEKAVQYCTARGGLALNVGRRGTEAHRMKRQGLSAQETSTIGGHADLES